MTTYWLIVQDMRGKIVPSKCRKVEGMATAKTERAALAEELGRDYLVVVETDSVARLYKSYRQFPGNELD